MSSKKQKRNNSNQLKLSGCMENPRKVKKMKNKNEDKKEDDKIQTNSINSSYVDDDMFITASYNRIENFGKDLISNKKIELSDEYDIQKLDKSLDYLFKYI